MSLINSATSWRCSAADSKPPPRRCGDIVGVEAGEVGRVEARAAGDWVFLRTAETRMERRRCCSKRSRR